jgi:hypothetical protein
LEASWVVVGENVIGPDDDDDDSDDLVGGEDTSNGAINDEG